MPADNHAPWLLVFLLFAAVALTWVIVEPFWVPLFIAAVLAAAFGGLMDGLSRALRGRRQLAAAIITFGMLIAVFAPLAGLGAVLVRQVLDGVQWVREALQSEGLAGLLARLPGPLQDAAGRIAAAIPEPRDLLGRLAGAQGGQAVLVVGGFIVATGTALLHIVLLLIAFFFFLVDGRRLVGWLDAAVPLRAGQLRALLSEFRRTSVAVLVATVATAGLQSVAAFLGYLIARAPNPLFLAMVTFVLALIPVGGATVTVIVVALIQLATGHPYSGVFLAAWGLGVVALVDNLVRPLLLKGGMEIHGGIVFFALLGGVAAFGAEGLVIGPLVVTFLLSALKLYQREFGTARNDRPM